MLDGIAIGLGRRRKVVACMGLAALSLCLYARTARFGFVGFDDNVVLTPYPNLYNESSLRSSLYEIFCGFFPREEPLLLRDVTWAIDARIFGFANPFGYHLGNIALNAANCALLFLFLLHASQRFGFALGISALFALLPIHVEPVSWVMGRKDVLSAFFTLLALLCQTHELASRERTRRRVLYLLSILCTGLALLSKMSAISCFLILALHRALHPYLDGRRAPDAPLPLPLLQTSREVAARIAPHAALTAIVFVWFHSVLDAWGMFEGRLRGPLDPRHLGIVVEFFPLIVLSYLKTIFMPGQLSAFYRWPEVDIPLTFAESCACAVTGSALLAAILYCCSRRRDLAFYLLAFFAFLLPYLDIFYVGIWRADRYIYLSSFCVLAIAATLAAELYTAQRTAVRRLMAACAVALGVDLGAQSFRQQLAWRDVDSFWAYEAHRSEPSLMGIQGLALRYVEKAKHQTDGARRERWIQYAREEVQRGFERERELGRRKSDYDTPDDYNLSRLHSVLAALDALEGAPVQTRLEHWRAAYEIYPTAPRAFRLATAVLELAKSAPEAERKRLEQQSLDYFVDYMKLNRRHPRELAHSIGALSDLYGELFPARVEELRTAAASGQL